MNEVGWSFENTYARLSSDFFAPAVPKPFRAPRVVLFNDDLAHELGLRFANVSQDELAKLFSGQLIPEGAEPIAQAYAGHQFGGFTMLGDGRAILLGEQRTPNGRLVDVQFKGPGPTTFSRRGDGLAALAPMLREYLISEAMHALRIPTTRSLAVVATGEPVFRERMQPGAVLTRIANSHLRVGTFQFAAARGKLVQLKELADYAIQRHDPGLASIQGSEKYLRFLEAVIARQAELIARWQLVGFIHGVMNTDNMTISGETIDYGPCAFMDRYDIATVFSSIDHGGRYAYGNQPSIAHWNLVRLAESLLPLMGSDQDQAVEQAVAALNAFASQFTTHWQTGMRHKLGLQKFLPDDEALIESLLTWMQESKADFTNTFASLSDKTWCEELSGRDAAFQAWWQRYQLRLAEESSAEEVESIRATSNPRVIPRNHLVEAALQSAEQGDMQIFEELIAEVRAPYRPRSCDSIYVQPAPDSGIPYRTYCGT